MTFAKQHLPVPPVGEWVQRRIDVPYSLFAVKDDRGRCAVMFRHGDGNTDVLEAKALNCQYKSGDYVYGVLAKDKGFGECIV